MHLQNTWPRWKVLPTVEKWIKRCFHHYGWWNTVFHLEPIQENECSIQVFSETDEVWFFVLLTISVNFYFCWSPNLSKIKKNINYRKLRKTGKFYQKLTLYFNFVQFALLDLLFIFSDTCTTKKLLPKLVEKMRLFINFLLMHWIIVLVNCDFSRIMFVWVLHHHFNKLHVLKNLLFLNLIILTINDNMVQVKITMFFLDFFLPNSELRTFFVYHVQI